MFKRFSAGFAAGYVLGARAGQKRYEQIADLAEKIMDNPVVSRAAGRAQDLATADNGRRLVESLKDRAFFVHDSNENIEDDEAGLPSDDEDERGDEADEDERESAASSGKADRHHARRRQAPHKNDRGKGRLGQLATVAIERGRVD